MILVSLLTVTLWASFTIAPSIVELKVWPWISKSRWSRKHIQEALFSRDSEKRRKISFPARFKTGRILPSITFSSFLLYARTYLWSWPSPPGVEGPSSLQRRTVSVHSLFCPRCRCLDLLSWAIWKSSLHFRRRAEGGGEETGKRGDLSEKCDLTSAFRLSKFSLHDMRGSCD